MYMRNLLFLVSFFLGSQGYACICMPVRILQRATEADFIATAKILEVTRDEANDRYHSVKIEIIDIYKGRRVDELKADFGTGSCAMYTPENTSWLIFAWKNGNGDLSFGYCAGAEQLDKVHKSSRHTAEQLEKAQTNYRRSIRKKLELLLYLKKRNFQLKNKYGLKTYFLNDCIRDIRGYQIESRPFAFYELEIDTSLAVTNIKALKQFGVNELDSKVLNCVKNDLVLQARKNEKSIPKPTKIILGLFYYEGNDRYKSFISQNIH